MKRISLKALTGVIAVAVVMPATISAQMQNKKIVIDGSTTVGPIAKAFAEVYMRKNPGRAAGTVTRLW